MCTVRLTKNHQASLKAATSTHTVISCVFSLSLSTHLATTHSPKHTDCANKPGRSSNCNENKEKTKEMVQRVVLLECSSLLLTDMRILCKGPDTQKLSSQCIQGFYVDLWSFSSSMTQSWWRACRLPHTHSNLLDCINWGPCFQLVH